MNFDINTLSMLAGMMGGKNPNSGAGGGMPQNGAMLETLIKLVSGMNGNAASGFNDNGNSGGANNMLSVLPMLMSLFNGKGAGKSSSDTEKSAAQNCEVNEKPYSDEQNNDTKNPRGNYEDNSDVNVARRPYEDYSRHSSRNRFSDIEFAGAEVSYIMAKLLRTAKYEKR